MSRLFNHLALFDFIDRAGKVVLFGASVSDAEQRGVDVMFTLRAVALLDVKTSHAVVLNENSGNSKTEERDTWPIQVAAASAFISGEAEDIQKAMLGDLLVGSETKASLAGMILAKDAAVKLLIGKCGGWKRRTEYAISEANTVEDLQVLMTTAEAELKAVVEGFQKALAATQTVESS